MGDPLIAARKLVTPGDTEVERLGALTRRVLERTKAAGKRYPEVTGIVLGGSLAKGTWLPGMADIDVFVKISEKTLEERFEEVGLLVGREVVKGYPHGKKYAQHPYTEATMEGVKVNVVPCYDVKPGKWKSAADRSPYHVEFVHAHFDGTKRLNARLLKQFLNAIGVYGAEIEMEGFSGYVAEVLIHERGSFSEVVELFAKAEPESEEEFMKITDPVDPKRNLAKAISRASFAKLVLASRAYLKRPSLEFFTWNKRLLRRALLRRAVAIMFEHRELSEDTLWGELKRTTKHLAEHSAAQGYRFIRAAPVSDNRTKSAILLLPETEAMPDLEERVGPHVGLEIETEKFLGKNRPKSRLLWVGDDGRVHSLQRRKHPSLQGLLKEVVAGGIREFGASKEVADAICGTGLILRGDRLAKAIEREEWLERGLREIISDTLGTDRR